MMNEPNITKIIGEKPSNAYLKICNEILFQKIILPSGEIKKISPQALGVFWRLMCLPPTWHLTLVGLCTLCGISSHIGRQCLNELMEWGYVEKKQTFDERGKFSKSIYLIRETINGQIDWANSIINEQTIEFLTDNELEEYKNYVTENGQILSRNDIQNFNEISLNLSKLTPTISKMSKSTDLEQYNNVEQYNNIDKYNNLFLKNNIKNNNTNFSLEKFETDNSKNSLSKENNNMEKTCSIEKNSSSLNSLNNSNMTTKNSYNTDPKELNCQKFTNRKMPRKKNSYNSENNSQQNLMQKFLTSTNGDNEDNSKKRTKNKVQQKEQQKGDTISTVDTQEFLRVMGELSVEDNQVAQYLAAAKQIAAENKRINQTNVKKMTNVKRLQTYAASCGAQADIIELLNKYIKVYVEKYGCLAKETFDELYKGLESKTGGNNSAMKELITMAIKYAWKDFYIPDGYKLPVKINSTKDCSNTEQEDKSDDLIPEDELDEDMYELATDEDGNYIEFR